MSIEIWHRLCHGESLDGLGIGLIGGRLDLRNLRLPEAEVTGKIRLPMADLNVLAGTTMIKGISWRSLDLSSSRLPHIRFLGCEIEDCIFDRAYLEDLRVWSTSFRNVSFRSADMRETSLGSVFEGRINTFENVDFTSADLRRTSWRDARLTGCTFKDAKLRQANFELTFLRDCTFEGELREVIFGQAGREEGALAPKEMERVDFSRTNCTTASFATST